MRRLIIPLAILLVLGLGVQVQAGSAQSLLDPYQVNLLEDVDYESGIIRQGTAVRTTLAAGDYLYGMYLIDGVQSETGPLKGTGLRNATTNTFTGIFLVEVASTELRTDGKYEYFFKPVASATWGTLFGAALAPTAANTTWATPRWRLPTGISTDVRTW